MSVSGDVDFCEERGAEVVANLVANGRKQWQPSANVEVRVLGVTKLVSRVETVAGTPRTRVGLDPRRIEGGADPDPKNSEIPRSKL